MKRTSTDITALLLRIALALIFIPHGWSKVMGDGGVSAFAHDLPSYGIPAFLGYISAWSELAGSILLGVGLLTRIDAFLLACTMGVATLVVQLPDALRDVQPGTNRYFAAMHGIELPFALLAVALAIVIIGPGRFSLDAVIRDKVKKKAAAGAAAVPGVILSREDGEGPGGNCLGVLRYAQDDRCPTAPAPR